MLLMLYLFIYKTMDFPKVYSRNLKHAHIFKSSQFLFTPKVNQVYQS